MAKLTKQEIGFTQVKNDVLNDKTLSLRDKGLFAFLFSKPDGWDFSSDRISEESADGRRAVLESLKVLEKRGYLSRKKLPNGRMEYCLKYTQSTETALWVPEPKYTKRTVQKTHSAEIDTISNTLSISNKEEEVTRNKDKSVFNGFKHLYLFPFPDWLNRQAWEDWVDYRKEIKKKMTDRTQSMQCALLKKYNKDEQRTIIESSIRNGWTGLFELKNNNSGSKKIYATQ